MSRQRLLDRFLRYVQVDTTAVEDSGKYPSCPGQMELGKLLVQELLAIGIGDAAQDEHGIVTGTVPGNVGENVPVVALCAHLDTSPETTGKNVKPQIIESYPGGDIVLPEDSQQVIRVAENPELESLVGKTLITTDGTTLLGADDKAGVAVIMEAVERMTEHAEWKHGPIRICLTCDEEIGAGTDHIDIEKLGAVVCYTIDGEGADTIDTETFSADMAVVTVRGKNIHPSIAKDRMINALRVAGVFLSALPRDRAPETTAKRQGFLHPYEMEGGVAEVTIRVLLREFDAADLEGAAEVVRGAAKQAESEFPGAEVDVHIKEQYRNLAEGLKREPRAVDYAEAAVRSLGREPKTTIVRGGTDGSRLTEKGLPTPNLSCGGHNPHSKLEWACLDQMESVVQWIVALGKSGGEKRGRRQKAVGRSSGDSPGGDRGGKHGKSYPRMESHHDCRVPRVHPRANHRSNRSLRRCAA